MSDLVWSFSKYWRRIRTEFLSPNTQGGIFILVTFFFSAYVMAVVFWREESDLLSLRHTNDACVSLRNCFVTMLRLSFYDPIGLDFLADVVNHCSGWLAALLVGYLCFTAMILLNGLIGVFGVTIFRESDSKTVVTKDDVNKLMNVVEDLLVEVRNLQTVESTLSGVEKKVENLTKRVNYIFKQKFT